MSKQPTAKTVNSPRKCQDCGSPLQGGACPYCPKPPTESATSFKPAAPLKKALQEEKERPRQPEPAPKQPTAEELDQAIEDARKAYARRNNCIFCRHVLGPSAVFCPGCGEVFVLQAWWTLFKIAFFNAIVFCLLWFVWNLLAAAATGKI